MRAPSRRAALAAACLALASGAAPAPGAGAAPIRLWPGEAPGEKGGLGAETDTMKPTDKLVANRTVSKIANISDPTIEVFRPDGVRDTGAAVLVCPGGGYYILALDLEGTETCAWLNSIGVTGVLLKYRVPRREGRPPYAAPLQDAQRAMGLIRLHAREWGIDPARVGALGFSAGGHLCAALGAAGPRTYPRVDAADDLGSRPDFLVLVYPAYLVAKGGLGLNPEVAVGAGAPPAFLAAAENDTEHVEDTLGYALALEKAGVPAELHVYPTGGHGFGLRPTRDAATTWPERTAEWMRTRGLLGPDAAPPPPSP